MSNKYALKAEARDEAGKGIARALRRDNKVPGVIYGDNKEAIKITMPAKEVQIEYGKGHMSTTLCDMEVGKEKHLLLARDIQLHPVTDNVQHVDFLRVTAKTKIKVMVPVKFVNEEECPALLEKGVMNIVRYDVELLCRATEIADFVEVDLTPFNIGDAVKISDAIMPEGSTPAIDDRDFTIATLMAPRAVVEEEVEVEGEDGEVAEGEEGAEGEAAEGGGDEKTEGDKGEG